MIVNLLKCEDRVMLLLSSHLFTKIFHSSATATARKKANKISFLLDKNGVRMEDHEGMCEVLRDYFTSLFTVEERHDIDMGVSGHRSVSTAQNTKLTTEFSFEEFTTVVKQMHPDKASGPDGLNPAFFFQSFWSIMGKEVFKYYTD